MIRCDITQKRNHQIMYILIVITSWSNLYYIYICVVVVVHCSTDVVRQVCNNYNFDIRYSSWVFLGGTYHITTTPHDSSILSQPGRTYSTVQYCSGNVGSGVVAQ